MLALKEMLRTKGYKVTPQRELIFRSFFELGKHVSVEELHEKVREKDHSIGYSTVWRNLKLICHMGLAEEVNIGDGITRYDLTTKAPHGHLYCLGCGKLLEFEVGSVVEELSRAARKQHFRAEGYRIEVQGYCEDCRENMGQPKKGQRRRSGK